jgi:hypothetical protein
MEKLACPNCHTEYDLRAVKTPGWKRGKHHVCCEVCSTVLRPFDQDHEIILIMTKYGAPLSNDPNAHHQA